MTNEDYRKLALLNLVMQTIISAIQEAEAQVQGLP